MALELRGRVLGGMGGSGRLWLQGRVGRGQCSVVVKIMEFLGSTSGKSCTFPSMSRTPTLLGVLGAFHEQEESNPAAGGAGGEPKSPARLE